MHTGRDSKDVSLHLGTWERGESLTEHSESRDPHFHLGPKLGETQIYFRVKHK